MFPQLVFCHTCSRHVLAFKTYDIIALLFYVFLWHSVATACLLFSSYFLFCWCLVCVECSNSDRYSNMRGIFYENLVRPIVRKSLLLDFLSGIAASMVGLKLHVSALVCCWRQIILECIGETSVAHRPATLLRVFYLLDFFRPVQSALQCTRTHFALSLAISWCCAFHIHFCKTRVFACVVVLIGRITFLVRPSVYLFVLYRLLTGSKKNSRMPRYFCKSLSG